jgi:hypothetical protein
MVLLTDGNLVLYDFFQSEELWSAQTNNTGTIAGNMRHEGYLVLYNATGDWTWETDRPWITYSASLKIMDDGHVVIFDGDQSIMWRIGTRRICSGVNFTNVLRTAFTRPDPKSAENTVYSFAFFALLGSVSVKAAPKSLVKLNPGELNFSKIFYPRYCNCDILF